MPKEVCENCKQWVTNNELQERYGVNCGRCMLSLKIVLCSQKGCEYFGAQKEEQGKVLE